MECNLLNRENLHKSCFYGIYYLHLKRISDLITPTLRISMCSSIYIIMAVGVERFLAVCRPHHYREVQARSKRVVFYIIPAILGAVIVNITKFLEVKTEVIECRCDCELIRR